MLTTLKMVTKFFFIIIRRIFILTNSYINTLLYIIQQTVAVDDEKLHYNIKKKFVTLKEEKLFALVFASSIN